MTSVSDVLLPPKKEILAADSATVAAGQPINPVHHSDWDALVKVHSDYSFFHSAAWAKTLASTYGYLPLYLIFKEAGAVHSLLPLMEVNSPFTGRRGIALPFTDDCGPLYQDRASAQRLVRSALELGKLRRWKSVEFRGGRELFPGAGHSLWFFGHRLNLEKEEDHLFGGLESSVRRAVRKAEKNGVTVTVSRDWDAMKAFYYLQCKTRRKHGLPPQPLAFFRNIYRHVFSLNLGMVAVARYQNHAIAALVYFQLGTQAVYKYGASDESFQQLRGANLVMWEAIKRLAKDGAKTLHFGRTSIANEGLRRFKLGWGADEYKIEYFKYDLRHSVFVTEFDASMGWHNRIFRALPLGVSRIVGAALYRHLA